MSSITVAQTTNSVTVNAATNEITVSQAVQNTVEPSSIGAPGPKGDTGEAAYDDLADFTLIFENGLI